MEATLNFENTKVIFKIAGTCSLAMALLFLLMKEIGLVQHVELRFLNLIFLYFGIRYLFVQIRKSNNGRLEYLPTLTFGFLTAVATSVLFGAFLYVYFNFLDPALLDTIRVSLPFGNFVTPAAAGMFTVMEGSASGAILSFALIHLMNGK